MVRDSDIRNLEMPEENAVGNSIAHRQHRLLGDDEAVIGYQVSLLDMHIATRRAQIERGILATVLLVMGVPCIVTVAILAVTVTEMHAPDIGTAFRPHPNTMVMRHNLLAQQQCHCHEQDKIGSLAESGSHYRLSFK